MLREEAIKTLLESSESESSDLKQEVHEIKEMLSVIYSLIVVQQKDACEAAGITAATVRNRVLRGDTEVLQKDGSRLNFLTLTTVGELKPRRRAKRKK